MSIFAWNCRGLESSLAVRTLTNAVKEMDPLLVFLSETKTGIGRIKGIQNKINFTQGIVVPSDGRSEGLALLWREGTEVTFKSYSHSHINVVVREESSMIPWRATRFYGHPDASKRYSSWQLLETLRDQCLMSWVVFGDFNEITHQHEKIGWLERDVNQMAGFRECLSRCGLFDLGFVGNGSLGVMSVWGTTEHYLDSIEWWLMQAGPHSSKKLVCTTAQCQVRIIAC